MRATIAKLCLPLVLIAVAAGPRPARAAQSQANKTTSQTGAVEEPPLKEPPLPGLTDAEARFFRYFDANEDGKISREEYRNEVVRFFERMDRMHHGYVTEDEVRRTFPSGKANGPSDPRARMSLTEFEDFMMARFDKADLGHKGYLTPQEFKNLEHTPK